VEERDPIAALERWTAEGAGYRVLELDAAHADVELLSCTGEPIDRLRSSDPALIAYLGAAGEAEGAD
jgi:hypothetical protein